MLPVHENRIQEVQAQLDGQFVGDPGLSAVNSLRNGPKSPSWTAVQHRGNNRLDAHRRMLSSNDHRLGNQRRFAEEVHPLAEQDRGNRPEV